MEYTLYTVGQKGDNFYLDINKAKGEKDRRKALGDTDFIIHKLTYYKSINGFNDVIEAVSLDSKAQDDKVYYRIDNNESYICHKMKTRGTKFKPIPEFYSFISNLFLEFSRMYPELKDVKVFKNLNKLERDANEFIKAIADYEKPYTLDEGINKFGLKSEYSAAVRITFAKSSYMLGNIKEGDKYLQRVDLTLANFSTGRLDAYFKEVLELRNVMVKEGKALVLTRFRKY